MRTRRAGEETLFSRMSLAQYLEERKAQTKADVGAMDADYVLSVSQDDLCQHLASELSLQLPVISEDKAAIADQEEVKVRDPLFGEVLPLVDGLSITIALPFEGDSALFLCSPSNLMVSNIPQAEVGDNELRLTYLGAGHDQAGLKEAYTRDLASITQNLAYVKADVDRFNSSLAAFVRDVVGQRKKKLLADAGLVASLGLPLRRRDDVPPTYAIPAVRKKPQMGLPKVAPGPFQPEPELPSPEYEHIIEILQSMGEVMERSPSAFRDMNEEDLRWVLLVPLNSHYEGQAAGEAFNYEGKTDILLRWEGKNVFIAECMIWDGPRSLTKKIDQLLRYTSWRDTKTAIILFNRRKSFTEVLAQIPDTVREHQCCKGQIEKRTESEFRCRFAHKDDANRELVLTVLAFDVPAPDDNPA